MDGNQSCVNISKVGSPDNIHQVDGHQSCDNIPKAGSSDKIYQVVGNQSCDNVSKIGNPDNIYQVDGNQSCSSVDTSFTSIDSDKEVDSEPIRAVLVPAQLQPGQPFALDVDASGNIDAPSSLPLTMVANFRSAYNKRDNIRKSLNTLGLDILIASESWERPRLPLEELLNTPHYKVLSYCRGREVPAIRQGGKHDGKPYPGKTGGGAAILFNKHRFNVIDQEIGVPAGVEAVWCVLAPCRLDDNLQRVRRICVGSIYIAPRSPFKSETVDHVIHTIHMVRAKYNNEIHFMISGDFNRVGTQDILNSYGALQQMCSVATRKGATLQIILTDLHTFMHPPTANPPIQVDEGKAGVDGDHQVLILAPKASSQFVVKREKRRIKTRPMPQSKISLFCAEFTQHKWEEVLNAEDVNQKVDAYHKYQRDMLDKFFFQKKM